MKTKRERKRGIAFALVTFGLVAIIAFCVTGTVMSRTDFDTAEVEAYYRDKEAVVLQETKALLKELGYQNSGVTLTRVVDAEGNREYTFTIHHGKIDKMSEAERSALAEVLLAKAEIDEICTFYHEFLLYE